MFWHKIWKQDSCSHNICYVFFFSFFLCLVSFYSLRFFFVFSWSSVLRFFDLFNFETSKHKARRAREFNSHWIVVQPPIFQFESHQEQTNQILLQLHLLYLVSSWLPKTKIWYQTPQVFQTVLFLYFVSVIVCTPFSVVYLIFNMLSSLDDFIWVGSRVVRVPFDN